MDGADLPVSRGAQVESRGLQLELLMQNTPLSGVSLSHLSLENQSRQRKEVRNTTFLSSVVDGDSPRSTFGWMVCWMTMLHPHGLPQASALGKAEVEVQLGKQAHDNHPLYTVLCARS